MNRVRVYSQLLRHQRRYRPHCQRQIQLPWTMHKATAIVNSHRHYSNGQRSRRTKATSPISKFIAIQDCRTLFNLISFILVPNLIVQCSSASRFREEIPDITPIQARRLSITQCYISAIFTACVCTKLSKEKSTAPINYNTPSNAAAFSQIM